jgi:hypothetical protein
VGETERAELRRLSKRWPNGGWTLVHAWTCRPSSARSIAMPSWPLASSRCIDGPGAPTAPMRARRAAPPGPALFRERVDREATKAASTTRAPPPTGRSGGPGRHDHGHEEHDQHRACDPADAGPGRAPGQGDDMHGSSRGGPPPMVVILHHTDESAGRGGGRLAGPVCVQIGDGPVRCVPDSGPHRDRAPHDGISDDRAIGPGQLTGRTTTDDDDQIRPALGQCRDPSGDRGDRPAACHGHGTAHQPPAVARAGRHCVSVGCTGGAVARQDADATRPDGHPPTALRGSHPHDDQVSSAPLRP